MLSVLKCFYYGNFQIDRKRDFSIMNLHVSITQFQLLSPSCHSWSIHLSSLFQYFIVCLCWSMSKQTSAMMSSQPYSPHYISLTDKTLKIITTYYYHSEKSNSNSLISSNRFVFTFPQWSQTCLFTFGLFES